MPQHAAMVARWMDLADLNACGVLACRVERSVALRPGIRVASWVLQRVRSGHGAPLERRGLPR
jgi:hypothetical protein